MARISDSDLSKEGAVASVEYVRISIAMCKAVQMWLYLSQLVEVGKMAHASQ